MVEQRQKGGAALDVMGASFWLCRVIIERWERRRKTRSGVHATDVQTTETQGS
jgi:hypothetical protein